MNKKTVIIFLAEIIVITILIFNKAIIGKNILAPLDIAPAIFSKYKWMIPHSNGIPLNHYIIDQLVYDLPLQYLIYETYRKREIPWWDPYTYCGRPLIADAHINATDPIRIILYMLLPFHIAYNWTKITHFLLTGVGMFILLCHWQFTSWICIGLSLAYATASCHALYFAHPWIQASFLYYPFLWLAWEKERKILAVFLTSAILYAGNLQSHAYLLLFIIAFSVTVINNNPQKILSVIISTIAGFVLALPVLYLQIEYFFIGARNICLSPLLTWFGGLLSFTAFYPWILGTFRTLDLSKFFNSTAISFHLYTGSITVLIAFLAIFLETSRKKLKKAGITLFTLYLIVVSSPLNTILYYRCANLGVMGLTILSAIGLETLWQNKTSFHKISKWMLIFLLILIAIIHIIAFGIYPCVIPYVRAFVESRNSFTVFSNATALRNFQIENLPCEISFLNPEVLIAYIGITLLILLLKIGSLRKIPFSGPLLLTINLISPILFFERFIPNQPLHLWKKLLQGGPEQRKICKILAGSSLRLWDIAPNVNDQLFPYNLSVLYRIRTVHGYSALRPLSFYILPENLQQKYKNFIADYIYESTKTGKEEGILKTNSITGPVRFQWLIPVNRKFYVIEDKPNKINIVFENGPAGKLIWSDSFYPGWIAMANGSKVNIKKFPPVFSIIDIPSNSTNLVLKYSPFNFLEKMKNLMNSKENYPDI